jgi:hypothetical protein
MNLFSQPVNAIRELGRVGNQIARRVPAGGPAVVEHNVLVAEILESESDDAFGGIEDDGFVEGASE